MIVLLSPSKTMEFGQHTIGLEITHPYFAEEAFAIAQILKKKKMKALMDLLKVSEKLALINYDRFQSFLRNPDVQNHQCAALTYTGEAFVGLQPQSFSESDWMFAQQHVRILSGLYGVLRPLDLIQAYRLEIATNLPINRSKNLYQFWKPKITEKIKLDLEHHKSNLVFNLSSSEYFKAIDTKKWNVDLVDFQFFENRKGKRTFVSFNAKKARGMMAAYIVKNLVTDKKKVIGFTEEGYMYIERDSTDQVFVFEKIID